MSVAISFKARQRFRQRLQNIEDADEILDAINSFLSRFIPVEGETTSDIWETIEELEIQPNSSKMFTFSVLGRESSNRIAALKRTGFFAKHNNLIEKIDVEQTDFTSRVDSNFNARIITDGALVLFQVKGASNNLTQWKGSIEIEQIGD